MFKSLVKIHKQLMKEAQGGYQTHTGVSLRKVFEDAYWMELSHYQIISVEEAKQRILKDPKFVIYLEAYENKSHVVQDAINSLIVLQKLAKE